MAKSNPPTLLHRSLFCLLGFGSFGWISTSALTGELKLASLSLLMIGGGLLLQRSLRRRARHPQTSGSNEQFGPP